VLWVNTCAEKSSSDDSPIYTVTYAFVRLYSFSSLSSLRSEGHCRLSLRLTCSGLLNSLTWLFLCRIIQLWYMVEYFFISSVTNGIWRSLCSVRFETYHGVFVMDRSTFDWNRWSTFVLDGLAHPKAEFHTSKSVLGYICIQESCFPVKVWIFVLGAKTFVVLLSLGFGALSWCISAKLAFSLGRDPDIWLLSVLVFVYYWLWQVGSSCILLWKLSGKILSGLFWFSICHTILVEDQDGIGVVEMPVAGHCLLPGERCHMQMLLL
jgi:hypothetical protein